MTVELRPLGVACNIRCRYCYQEPQRSSANLSGRYDIEAMKQAILEQGGPFTMFGGEPLLVPVADLEELWAWGLENFGQNGIQTNGTLVTPEHIELFRKYKVHVGISMDGPGELNRLREAGSPHKTDEATRKSEDAIERLCEAGLAPSLIVTLTERNALRKHLPLMADWFRTLEALGVRSARLHLLEIEDEAQRLEMALSDAENIEALEYFEGLALEHLRFDMFDDMACMLMGRDSNTTCVWNACDPYTTRAVQGVEGFGQKSNCGRTNKDGIDYVKSDGPGFERYVALYHTPQEQGGCEGCRFFIMCKGQCPGTALAQDWRYRTEHCNVIMTLFRKIEERLLDEGETPVSTYRPVREEVEAHLLHGWQRGQNHSIEDYLRQQGYIRDQTGCDAPASGSSAHGDHYDSMAS